MIAAPGIQLAYYKRALARGITARDCILLTWIGAGLLLAYHLWVASGCKDGEADRHAGDHAAVVAAGERDRIAVRPEARVIGSNHRDQCRTSRVICHRGRLRVESGCVPDVRGHRRADHGSREGALRS